jgi:hypothetical protein
MKYRVTISLASILLASSGVAAAPAKTKPGLANAQPFTYTNVVSFFKSAHLRATEVQKRCTVLFEGEWKNADIYNYCLIIVENSDEDVQVTFYLTHAHEMNWVTEFLDAPFFARDETQKLFTPINSRRDARGERLGRFRVDFHRWQPKHAEIIVFSFTPLQNVARSSDVVAYTDFGGLDARVGILPRGGILFVNLSSFL